MHALLQVVLVLVLVAVAVAMVMSARRRRLRAQQAERRAAAEAKAKATARRQAIEDAAQRQVTQVRQQDSAIRQARETVESAAARRASEEAARAQVARRAAAEAALAEAGRVEAARSRAARAADVGAAELAAEAVADAARREGDLLAQRRRELERDMQRQAQTPRPAERRTLERQPAPAVQSPVASTAAAPKSPENTVVMIADDSKVVRIKTGRLLAQHRYKVALATDGVDAAHQIQAKLPDVVIIDVEMPGMDGFQLTRRLRRNPATAHIPIIMITSADDKYRESAKRSGVDVLLGKPYSEDALIGHIRSAMTTPARARQPEMA